MTRVASGPHFTLVALRDSIEPLRQEGLSVALPPPRPVLAAVLEVAGVVEYDFEESFALLARVFMDGTRNSQGANVGFGNKKTFVGST